MQYKVILYIEFRGRLIPYEGRWCNTEKEARKAAYDNLEQYIPAGMYNVGESVKTKEVA